MAATDSSVSWPHPAAGKSCGSCMMCCKLTAIARLEKPSGKWCRYALPGRGCGVYADRPAECQSFFCEWIIDPSLGPEWKPDKSKFLSMSDAAGVVSIIVDASAPGAWREPRYYNAIKLRGARIFEQGGMLIVYVGSRATIILPDRDLDAGFVPDGHTLRLISRIEHGKTVYDVAVEPSPTV